MIIVKLRGGLGNQMFQYACGLALARKHSTGLALDHSYLEDLGQLDPEVTVRPYELGAFGIDNKITMPSILKLFETAAKRGKEWEYKYYNQLLEADFDENLSKLGSNLYIEGYFQDARYFKGITGLIRDEFQFPGWQGGEKYAEQIYNVSNSVSVHVRRGDVLSDFYKTILHNNTEEYYYKAVKRILNEVPSPHFFVFSADDPHWAASLFDKISNLFIHKGFTMRRIAATYDSLPEQLRHFFA